MLAAHLRIRRSQDFRRVLRAPARAATSTVVVHLDREPPRQGQPARAGFVVGRAVGGAVTRNRVVRRLRHLMAPQLAELPEGVDVVVRALPPAADASWSRLQRDLHSAVRRACERLPAVGQDTGTAGQVTP